jgi:hypothetical protein
MTDLFEFVPGGESISSKAQATSPARAIERSGTNCLRTQEAKGAKQAGALAAPGTIADVCASASVVVSGPERGLGCIASVNLSVGCLAELNVCSNPDMGGAIRSDAAACLDAFTQLNVSF